MANIDISGLDEYFCAQIARLLAAKQDGDTSRLKQEISRTRAIIEVSKRIMWNTHLVREYFHFTIF